MGLTVDSAAANTALIELATVKDELGITTSDEDDKLTRLIAAVSSAIAKFLDFPPWQQTYTETLAGSGTTLIVLARQPIISISQVTVENSVVTDYSIQNANIGLLFRESGWPWPYRSQYPSLSPDPRPGIERLNIGVTYVAGWVLPTDGGTQTLPVDIEDAAFDTVKRWYRDEASAGSSGTAGALVSRRMGRTTETYSDVTKTAANATPFDLTPRSIGLLSGYKKVA